jgi:hypothetical protein
MKSGHSLTTLIRPADESVPPKLGGKNAGDMILSQSMLREIALVQVHNWISLNFIDSKLSSRTQDETSTTPNFFPPNLGGTVP